LFSKPSAHIIKISNILGVKALKKTSVKTHAPAKLKTRSVANRQVKEMQESLRDVKMMQAGHKPKRTWAEIRNEI